ncbi:MAG: prepilin-type N-terminal cleavage/methylation domain-containing protein [Burkholderiales bacterium]|nr:prepilin-type N-terminal cleavage/methylation domain-containing protein [Pseudomonadota bacterium]MCC7069235.1 prepilin-type N-terminal cleavage/methylation domain-containing protein [Burkholderiales bacterium]
MSAPVRHRVGGFTLIELLAAITLLAVLTAVLMGSVRGAERSTAAAAALGERTEQYARTYGFLREHLAGALPLRWRREVGQPLKFAGRSDSVTYLAPITSQIATGGVNWWQLIVAPAANHPERKQLVLRRAAPDPEEKSVPDIPAADPIVLADHIESLTLAYFDPGDDPLNNPDAGTWRDAWDENARMPAMIRIQITEQGGAVWPELRIPLKLTQALGCNFDFQRQRCIIQAGPRG